MHGQQNITICVFLCYQYRFLGCCSLYFLVGCKIGLVGPCVRARLC